ncbi:hypothetical protein ADH76_00010 [Enterocloster clostridioformis]|uniref:hypothetical protein n=1 Tax=Enterocloster clostridioformis TaxID=1531 RepID=UPI00080C984F|nr:hypothetical protein [Enterocloster clostridioformis]ANU45177.1 hypothetical protein A4V08_04380 [Lachnoclostridium sp. YL32]NDO27446.1 hypothetical protein [Enterocloster clostridioformis]OXE69910.1 hypothetical protein ADH76_00010 [Enterocloster clostridioformis]QQR00057.1 hypothetical protein I5Q83_30245 [Enterocloster clostridioformis]
MNEKKLILQGYLRNQIRLYRNTHAFSQENMAEFLHVSPRSYIDQEHGKYGFSALTLIYYVFLLTDEETLIFFRELKNLIGGRNKDVA